MMDKIIIEAIEKRIEAERENQANHIGRKNWQRAAQSELVINGLTTALHIVGHCYMAQKRKDE